jgi:predicted signal transduction protein with EAL and GGDEF domain
LGHDAGDQLLIETAHRMKNVLREGDTLARMGGDEFVALLNGVDNIHDVEQVIERLLHACSQPWSVDGQVVQVSASIGVTLYPHDLVEVDQLLRHADQAMYQAKQAGRNRYHLFDPVHDSQMKERRQMQDTLRAALASGEFLLHYQPQVNLVTGEVLGFEALVRWNKPGQGLVGPGAFLHHLEGTDLGYQLEAWVLNQALTDLSHWHMGGMVVSVAVNISAPHLQHNVFPQTLNEVLATHPAVCARHLELEIVESSALDDLDNVSRVMATCHELGVRFAVDDFGTGYSSLTYLKRLPAETLKIDQSFVRDMLEDQEDMAIVQGVIGLAAAFNRRVVAEGVETMAQLHALVSLGCDRGQGFGIGRPMAAAQVSGWFVQWQTHRPWVQG